MRNEIKELLKKLTPNRLQKDIRNYIIYKLRMNGYTISTFARKIGVTPQAISNCLRTPYPRIQREIAKTIGENPERLWPGRYGQSGKSNRSRASQKIKDSTVEKNIKGKDLIELSNLKNGGGE
jgi:Ner family transcriptional regulator